MTEESQPAAATPVVARGGSKALPEIHGTRCFASQADDNLLVIPVLLFRRLEPGDGLLREGVTLSESPYIEGRRHKIAIGKSTLAALVQLSAARAKAFPSASVDASFMPLGVVVSGAGGLAVCAWLGFVPPHWSLWLAGVALLAFVALLARRAQLSNQQRASIEAWETSDVGKSHLALQKELREGWLRLSTLAREQGLQTELRVAEGSVNPARLRTLSPGVLDEADEFVPEDFVAGEKYSYCVVQQGVIERRSVAAAPAGLEATAEATTA